jgi:hypothetical protein
MKQLPLTLPVDVAWYRERLRALREEHRLLAIADHRRRGTPCPTNLFWRDRQVGMGAPKTPEAYPLISVVANQRQAA